MGEKREKIEREERQEESEGGFLMVANFELFISGWGAWRGIPFCKSKKAISEGLVNRN